jgi:hypothetical protein
MAQRSSVARNELLIFQKFSKFYEIMKIIFVILMTFYCGCFYLDSLYFSFRPWHFACQRPTDSLHHFNTLFPILHRKWLSHHHHFLWNLSFSYTICISFLMLYVTLTKQLFLHINIIIIIISLNDTFHTF